MKSLSLFLLITLTSGNDRVEFKDFVIIKWNAERLTLEIDGAELTFENDYRLNGNELYKNPFDLEGHRSYRLKNETGLYYYTGGVMEYGIYMAIINIETREQIVIQQP